jgi:multidrug efflux pump subunit AcrA (membrane-fusion protein)
MPEQKPIPTSPWDKTTKIGPWEFPSWYIGAALLGLLFIVVVAISPTPEERAARRVQEQAAQQQALQQQRQREVLAAQQEQANLMQEVEDNLAAVKTALTSKGCAEGPEMCLLLINGSSALLEKAKQSNLSEAHKKRVKEFRDALVAAQVRSFPSIRKGYGKVFAEKLWENDLTARTFGEGYRTVEFTGALLAANRNIKTAMATAYPILRALRMKQARFKWTKAADEYTYYTVQPTYSDKAILVWDGMLVREVPLN